MPGVPGKVTVMFRNPVGPGKNRRSCPALNADISTQLCGQSRISAIACTPDCAFNPFAIRNYEQFLQLEAAVIPKAHEFLGRYLGEAGSKKLAGECRTNLDAQSNGLHTLAYGLIHGLFMVLREIGTEGIKSMGWKNDEVI